LSKSNSTIRVPSLSLIHDFRQDLWIPLGTLYVNPDKGPVLNLSIDVTVGDIVSERHSSSVKVVDFKTKRTTMDYRGDFSECNYLIINQPGSISLHSFTIINSTERGTLCIMGEEDLLTILFLLKPGKKIAYGQPDTGVVVVESSMETAIKVFKILKATVIQYGMQPS
jgi:Uncharacterized protein conserved in archaea